MGPSVGRRGPNPGNSLHINIHVNLVDAVILTRDYLHSYKAFYDLNLPGNMLFVEVSVEVSSLFFLPHYELTHEAYSAKLE